MLTHSSSLLGNEKTHSYVINVSKVRLTDLENAEDFHSVLHAHLSVQLDARRLAGLAHWVKTHFFLSLIFWRARVSLLNGMPDLLDSNESCLFK